MCAQPSKLNQGMLAVALSRASSKVRRAVDDDGGPIPTMRQSRRIAACAVPTISCLFSLFTAVRYISTHCDPIINLAHSLRDNSTQRHSETEKDWY